MRVFFEKKRDTKSYASCFLYRLRVSFLRLRVSLVSIPSEHVEGIHPMRRKENKLRILLAQPSYALVFEGIGNTSFAYFFFPFRRRDTFLYPLFYVLVSIPSFFFWYQTLRKQLLVSLAQLGCASFSFQIKDLNKPSFLLYVKLLVSFLFKRNAHVSLGSIPSTKRHY